VNRGKELQPVRALEALDFAQHSIDPRAGLGMACDVLIQSVVYLRLDADRLGFRDRQRAVAEAGDEVSLHVAERLPQVVGVGAVPSRFERQPKRFSVGLEEVGELLYFDERRGLEAQHGVFKRRPFRGDFTDLLCPRGDLNPHSGEISPDMGLNSKTGEESPDWGVHANIVTGAAWLPSSDLRWLAASRGLPVPCHADQGVPAGK